MGVACRLAAYEVKELYSFACSIRSAKATVRTCPRKGTTCVNRDNITVLRSALQLPKTFVLGLAWASPNATQDCVRALLDCIELDLDLANVFDRIGHPNSLHRDCRVTSALVRLSGVLCYYGSHYVVFWQSTELGGWTSFDDVTVRRVKSWDEVREKCVRGRLQPLLLFYSRP